MSNPTTPFNWQMPTNTDLVTDLPADFEVFGQAVATSMADLLGGTSGQILSKNSNTDMDFVWVDNQVGDITSITATSPLTGGGTGGDVTVGIQAASTTQSGAVQLTDSTSSTSTTTAATPNSVKSAFDAAGTAQTTANAAIPKSTVTTAGDVIYATGSGAVTRLGIGTAGQVLTVNGGATAPSWATPSGGGGMTAIATGTFSSTLTSITSIPNTYKRIELVINGAVAATSFDLWLTVNSITSSSYFRVFNAGYGSSSWSSITTSTSFPLVGLPGLSSGIAANNNSINVVFPNYANTSNNKLVMLDSTFVDGGSNNTILMGDARILTNNAISSIQINCDKTLTGGTYTLYGVN